MEKLLFGGGVWEQPADCYGTVTCLKEAKEEAEYQRDLECEHARIMEEVQRQAGNPG